MNTQGSYREVLNVRGVQPFLWLQFFNAFNDNMYKLVVSLLAVGIVGQARSGYYLSLANFIFVAPFLIFASYAGQLADRFEKRSVVLLTKAIEIAAMLFALFALRSGNVDWMLAVLFFTATQAAFFSPAKYGIVPELVSVRHIARANGLLEMSTFVAIILGTVGGGFLVGEWKHQPTYIGLTLVGVAIVGTSMGFRMTRTPVAAMKRSWTWNPVGDMFHGFSGLVADRTLLITVIGTTYFWFLGALLQILLLLFGAETLHASEAKTSLLMASLAIGIGAGSMLAGRLSGEKIEPGLVPIGAFGMGIGALVLAYFVHSLPAAAVWLIFTGMMGGLFIVPLNAILQHRPLPDQKGRVIATANVVNTLGMMCSSGVVWIFHGFIHLTAAGIMALAGVLTLGAAVASFRIVPNFTMRFLIWLLAHTVYRIRIIGRENMPQQGPALLVANHVTFVDGFLINSCMQRFVRFMVYQSWYDRFPFLFRWIHAIRVPDGTRRAIIYTIAAAREELKQGHVVCIFAEGSLTRTGNIAEFLRGLEKIAVGLNVPVIPVNLGGGWGSIFSLDPRAGLWRSIRKMPHPISIAFGKPMVAPQAAEVRQAVLELAAEAGPCGIREGDSLGTRFVETARSFWRERALTDSTGRTLSYGETLAASWLLARRMKREHAAEKMIGVMLPASTAAAVVNLGIVLAGKVPVNLNFTAGREALDSAIEQCALKTIYTSEVFLSKAKIERRTGMRFAEEALRFSKTSQIAAFASARLLPTRMLVNGRAKADDLAAVLFSSGSTAAPKGVMLSHRNLMANAASVHDLFPVNERDTIAGVLPLFHSFGFTYTLWFPLLHGASAAYHASPLDAKGLGELIEKTKATFLPVAPTFCHAYLRGCSKEQFASLKHVLVGAEKLQTALARAFEEKFGLPLLEGYGVTEMSPVISVNVPDREQHGITTIGTRAGTVGQTVPGVAAKVVHLETGEALPHGTEGVLLVKGVNRMLGYLNRPDETAAVLRDGWYVTGDIVVMDADGFIRIVDRQSRFSKIGGEMVPHGKVEEALRTILDGEPCCVTAVSDERKGERLVALIAAPNVLPKEVWQKLMASELPKMWIPKLDDIRIVNALPVLGSGKLDLRAAKRLAAEMVSAAAI
jgi:acyl-[acyl-carrier-protein]-phospholipid O-acyltransferase/long-chain-fatty-acid--[acyl-carrier-protein] ligase